MPRTAATAEKPQPPADVDPRFARIANAFAKDRRVTYGKMFASMGLKVNGRIFAMFVKGRFVTKLPRERVDDLVRRGAGAYFDPGHGRLMKEWVAMEDAEALWLDLARDARRFVGGAKP
jgi:TfoX/Sxy family transcriptional regulator of competence genes